MTNYHHLCPACRQPVSEYQYWENICRDDPELAGASLAEKQALAALIATTIEKNVALDKAAKIVQKYGTSLNYKDNDQD